MILLGISVVALAVYLALGAQWFPSMMVTLVPALLLYLLAHCLRALRIFLLLYDGRLRASETLLTHIHAAGVSMLIPWKLGEIYRIVVFQGLSPTFRRVLMSVWVERIWDTIALLLLLLIPSLMHSDTPINSELLLMMLAFLCISAFLFLVLPENINLVKRYLIVRKRSDQALWMLIWVDRIHTLLITAYRLLCYRVATMAWITCGIWTLELGALWLALHVPSTVTPTGGATHLLQAFAQQLSAPVPWMTQSSLLDSLSMTYHLLSISALCLLALLCVPALLLKVFRDRAGSWSWHRTVGDAMITPR